jgi:hypothetical protein
VHYAEGVAILAVVDVLLDCMIRRLFAEPPGFRTKHRRKLKRNLHVFTDLSLGIRSWLWTSLVDVYIDVFIPEAAAVSAAIFSSSRDARAENGTHPPRLAQASVV